MRRTIARKLRLDIEHLSKPLEAEAVNGTPVFIHEKALIHIQLGTIELCMNCFIYFTDFTENPAGFIEYSIPRIF
jgi:hypothetical protein